MWNGQNGIFSSVLNSRVIQAEVCKKEIPESSCLETAVRKEGWLRDDRVLNLESAM